MNNRYKNKNGVTKEESQFFQKQMQGVKPLQRKNKVILKKIQTTKPQTAEETFFDEEKEFPFSDKITNTVTADEKLYFYRSGVQDKVLKSLRAGKIQPTEILDLHGASVAQARTLLSQFLMHCIQAEQRCALIIHGKGKLERTKPILKNCVNSWLPQHPAVLAFCSALARDGGTGSIYVLLKRHATCF